MPDIPAPETPPVVTGEAKTVSASSIVNEDKDGFPAGSPPPPPIAPPGDNGAPAPEVRRGRGRPPGAKNKPREGDAGGMPPPIDPPKPPVNYDAMALAVFGMTTGILAQTIGEEWLPRAAPPGQPGEQEMVCHALAAYMRSKEMPDLPPGVMLCLVCAMYAGPRFQAPKTKEKVKGIWYWFRSKFGKKGRTAVVNEQARQPEKKDTEKKEPDKGDGSQGPAVTTADGVWMHG